MFYKDPQAALAWLEAAFGFEPVMVGRSTRTARSVIPEMRFGDGLIYVGREWDKHRSKPGLAGWQEPQSINVRLDQGMDEHCERARAAGAVITREPVDQFYGDRTYVAVDPEGHIWSFSQTIRAMTHEEMAKAGGREVRTRL